MILLLKISIILLVIVPLGLMFYVDMYHCARDFAPSGLYFVVCSETFGFKTILYEISNAVYSMFPSNDEDIIIPLCKDVNWLYNGKCLEPKPGFDQTITKIPFHNDLQEIIIDEDKGGNDYGITTNMVFSYMEYSNAENLDAVFRSCENWEKARETNFTSPDGTKYVITSVGYSWFNSTHYIDNNICDFISMKKHMEYEIIRAISEYCNSPNKVGFDNPYEYWFANETHYMDADTCLWQILDNDIPLVLPDDWENVYTRK